MGLIEDDEAVVERATAHESQWSHLQNLAFVHLLHTFGVDHVVHRVVQRTQIWVDLGHQVTGQESQTFAGLDGGSREDDSLHLTRLQGVNRHRHREPTLARAGRSDSERDDVAADRIDVALLPRGLRLDRAPLGATKDFVGEHRTGAGVLLDHGDAALDDGVVHRLAALQQQDQFFEQSRHDGGVGSVDGQFVAPSGDVGARKGALDQSQVSVAGTQETGHQMRARHDQGGGRMWWGHSWVRSDVLSGCRLCTCTA